MKKLLAISVLASMTLIACNDPEYDAKITALICAQNAAGDHQHVLTDYITRTTTGEYKVPLKGGKTCFINVLDADKGTCEIVECY